VGTDCLWEAGVDFLPPHGSRVVDVVTSLNLSDEPNLSRGGGDRSVSVRDVTTGEVLTVDDGTLEA
jgi:hypothetical protein